ncbi:double-strand break repair protein MRE11-like isoform X2 [Asterias amurensis]|uniref:double-strand break repair protein MRE11-like isoform X2 n=1 Tax=Asterias amurensis TaxID=7602 RepID=UPI003AB20FCA
MSYSFSDQGNDSPPRNDDEDKENTIKILIATDCHIGYAEKDGVRHSDSLNTFEEILQHAQKQKVDMILLGGDLFHENKPSRKSLHGCMALIRKYCMGDRPVGIQFLSDQSLNFAASPFPVVNYEDPNINVETPVFSIHGNHDDPAGLGNLCALDILSVSGLVNYFGKCNSLEKIDVIPLLIKKGTTRLALYGIGSVRDERMHRIFVNRKIRFFQPKDESTPWFSLLTLHQNRTKHGETNYIPEQFLPDFLDLVLWGHEHECKVEPIWNDRQHFFVTQPGSSIATSLSQGEAVQKHVCLLQIRAKAMKCTKIRLETVRPFYMRDITLMDTDMNPNHASATEHVEAFCAEKVEALISQAEDEMSGHPKQPKLPLIRLRVDYSGGFETFNINRFGQKFVNRLANTKDIVLFHKRKLQAGKRERKPNEEDMDNYLRPDALDAGRVEDLVKQYFTDADEHKKLSLLSEKDLCQAVQEFVDKEEKDAILELVKFELERTQGHLKSCKTTDTFILEELKHFKDERKKMSDADETKEIRGVMDKAKEKRQQRGDSAGFSDDDQSRADSDESESSNTSTTRGGGRGRRRGRGSTTRGRGSTAKGSTAKGSSAKGQVSRGGTLKNFLSKEKSVTSSFAEGTTQHPPCSGVGTRQTNPTARHTSQNQQTDGESSIKKMRVLEFEKERTSEVLDAVRDLQFCKDKGHGAIQSAVTEKGQRPELFVELISAQTDEPEPILPFPKDLILTDIETEVLFREVAEKLGEGWERLATYLGQRRSDLYAVKRDSAGDVRDQIFCMLVRWQQKLGPFGKNAFDTLSSGLERINRNDLVKFLNQKATRYRR